MISRKKSNVKSINTAKCQEMKADGTRCRANAQRGSKYCFFHDPAKTQERTAAREAGGSRGRAAILEAAPDVPLTSNANVITLLGETINQVRRGDLDPKVSNAIGYLTGILLKALEQGHLEERLVALEEIINHRPQTTDRPFHAIKLEEEVDFAFAAAE